MMICQLIEYSNNITIINMYTSTVTTSDNLRLVILGSNEFEKKNSLSCISESPYSLHHGNWNIAIRRRFRID